MAEPVFLGFGGGTGFFGGDGLTTFDPAGRPAFGPLPAVPDPSSPVVFFDPATRTPSSPMFIYPPLYTVLFTVEPPAPEEVEVRGGPAGARHRFEKSFEQRRREAQAALEKARARMDRVGETADEVTVEEAPSVSERASTYQELEEAAQVILAKLEGVEQAEALRDEAQALLEEAAMRRKREGQMAAALAAMWEFLF